MAGEKQAPPADRRAREALRRLIDEMMEQLRDACRRDAWTAEERERAEQDLQRIMDSVRREALRDMNRSES